MNQKFKKCKVIMLPTKELCQINYLMKFKGGYSINRYKEGELGICKNINGYDRENWIKQHLYIVSDEDVKKGDYIYQTVIKSIIQAPFDCVNDHRFSKIIAITDSTLTIKYLGTKVYDPSISCEKYGFKSGVGLQSHLRDEPFPSIPVDFIKSYCDKQVDEVLVEYYDTFEYESPIWKLKVNPDNTINIKSVKDTYTRDEVIKLCKNAFNTGHDAALKSAKYLSSMRADEWITKNL